MKEISFCGYNWITQERWGQVHPEKKYVWYDENAVIPHNDNEISLLARYNPKNFDNIGLSELGIGLISCTNNFDYGRFELEAMLPNLPYSWPAFWMWSWSDWPPEIDVFEAYSDQNGSYKTSLCDRFFKHIFFNVRTNVHIKNDTTKWDIKDTAHFLSYSDPRKNFNKFCVDWQPDKIEFHYNDRLVRLVDDKNLLTLLNNHKMNVVINNSCYRPHKDHKTNISEMRIKNFKYTPFFNKNN
jgi:beta-glucanase (GH16 family)